MFAFLYRSGRSIIRQFSSKRSFSSDVALGQSSISTASYLVASCGLSADAALSLSEKFAIRSTERSDAVLQLLRDYGFTNSHINRLVSKWPEVLAADPEKTLKPKLEFFTSIGMALQDMAKGLSYYPGALRRSLEGYIVPFYSFLQSIPLSDDLVVRVFLRCPRTFAFASPADSARNLAVLRERGVPESRIVSFFVYHPSIMNMGSEKFAACINHIVEIGFSGTKYNFLDALQVFVNMSDSTLERKREAYKSYGWSETDVSAAFLRHPICMSLSEKKIKENMNFLVKEVGLEAVAVARRPVILGLSLEKRLKPRFSIIRTLSGKGILKGKPNFMELLMMSEKKFVQRYVVVFKFSEVKSIENTGRGYF